MLTIITGLLSLVAANGAGLAAGGAVGTALELSMPWLTKAHTARRTTRIVSRWFRKEHNRQLSPRERANLQHVMDTT